MRVPVQRQRGHHEWRGLATRARAGAAFALGQLSPREREAAVFIMVAAAAIDLMLTFQSALGAGGGVLLTHWGLVKVIALSGGLAYHAVRFQSWGLACYSAIFAGAWLVERFRLHSMAVAFAVRALGLGHRPSPASSLPGIMWAMVLLVAASTGLAIAITTVARRDARLPPACSLVLNAALALLLISGGVVNLLEELLPSLGVVQSLGEALGSSIVLGCTAGLLFRRGTQWTNKSHRGHVSSGSTGSIEAHGSNGMSTPTAFDL